jgi:hypothetical protein
MGRRKRGLGSSLVPDLSAMTDCPQHHSSTLAFNPPAKNLILICKRLMTTKT